MALVGGTFHNGVTATVDLMTHWVKAKPLTRRYRFTCLCNSLTLMKCEVLKSGKIEKKKNTQSWVKRISLMGLTGNSAC